MNASLSWGRSAAAAPPEPEPHLDPARRPPPAKRAFVASVGPDNVGACPNPEDDAARQCSLIPSGGGVAGAPATTAAAAAAPGGLDAAVAFTPREEEREWASVSPAEMLEIESDLRGLSLSSPLGSLPDLLDSSASMGEDGLCAAILTDEDMEAAFLPSLEAELVALTEADKEAYLEARRKCPDRVDDEHKKAFLRKDEFDVKLAAKRIALHWKYKEQLFSPEKCFLPMTLSDALDHNDMLALSEGFFQLLPRRDAHGRAIVFITASRLFTKGNSRESVLRAFWYLLHVAGEDPCVQRKGVVFLLFPNNPSFWSQFDPFLFRELTALVNRYTATIGRAVHMCHPGKMFHLVSPVLKFQFEERMRKRFRIHYGSREAVLRSLAEFGLGKDCLPCELGGDLPQLEPVKWLSNRLLFEGILSQSVPCTSQNGIGDQNARTERESCTVPASVGVDAIKASPVPSGIQSSAFTLQSANVQATLDEVCQMASRSIQSRQSKGDSSADGFVLQNGISPATITRENQKDSRDSCVASDTSSKDIPCKPCHSTLSSTQPLSPKPCLLTKASRATLPEKKKKEWRDLRMERAVQAKLASPDLPLFDALVRGGFVFPAKKRNRQNDKEVHDSENVSLRQRKNQLCRRLRAKRADEEERNASLDVPNIRDSETSLGEAEGSSSASPSLLPAASDIRTLHVPNEASHTMKVSEKLQCVQSSFNGSEDRDVQ